MHVEHAVNTDCLIARLAKIGDRLARVASARNSRCEGLCKLLLTHPMANLAVVQSLDQRQELEVDLKVLGTPMRLYLGLADIANSDLVVRVLDQFLDAVGADRMRAVRQDRRDVLVFVEGCLATVTCNRNIGIFRFLHY